MLDFLAALVLFPEVAHVLRDLLLSLFYAVLNLALHVPGLLLFHPIDLLEPLPMADLITIELLGTIRTRSNVLASLVHLDRLLNILEQGIFLELLLLLLRRCINLSLMP